MTIWTRQSRSTRSARAAIIGLLAAIVAGPAIAQEETEPPKTIDEVLTDLAQPDPPRRRPRGGGPGGRQGPPQAPAPEAPAPKADADTPAKPDVYFAITGAIVHTVSGPVLQDSVILCKNGKIEAVGPGIKVPEKAEILDASGFHVYPGLVAVRSVALIGGEPPEDTTDCFTLQATAALAGGITTVLTGNTAAKITIGTVDNMVVRRNIFESIRYRAADPAGKKRLRESLDNVRQYMRELDAHEDLKKRDPSAKAPDDRAVKAGEGALHYRLLKHEAVALVDADTTYDIIQICELAEEYGIRFVIRGAREAWTLAPRLGRAGVSAIVTPRTRDDPDPQFLRPTGATIENAAKLHQHGVTVAIVPSLPGVSFGGLGGRDLMQLNLEAAFAVRGGLPEEIALRAITLDAARVLGIDDRVGSIQPGKDADFVIVDQPDILHYTTMSRWTIVNATVMYDKYKDTFLSHVRPNGDENAPPPADVWPRRLGDEQ
jgi:imidazolonepropionase-like amidohydrolase